DRGRGAPRRGGDCRGAVLSPRAGCADRRSPDRRAPPSRAAARTPGRPRHRRAARGRPGERRLPRRRDRVRLGGAHREEPAAARRPCAFAGPGAARARAVPRAARPLRRRPRGRPPSGRRPGARVTSMHETGTMRVKGGLAEMLKGGVIMDVVDAEQAKIAETAGACAVMALERVPADIRRDGGVARMSDPDKIKEIQEAVTIPVMAKCRIGHFAEAQILQALEIDYIDESE